MDTVDNADAAEAAEAEADDVDDADADDEDADEIDSGDRGVKWYSPKSVTTKWRIWRAPTLLILISAEAKIAHSFVTLAAADEDSDGDDAIESGMVAYVESAALCAFSELRAS